MEPPPLPKPSRALSEKRLKVTQDRSKRLVHARYETEGWRTTLRGRRVRAGGEGVLRSCSLSTAGGTGRGPKPAAVDGGGWTGVRSGLRGEVREGRDLKRGAHHRRGVARDGRTPPCGAHWGGETAADTGIEEGAEDVSLRMRGVVSVGGDCIEESGAELEEAGELLGVGPSGLRGGVAEEGEVRREETLWRRDVSSRNFLEGKRNGTNIVDELA